MDWNDKFHSILKETERNLSKAKGKLSSKVSNAHKITKGGTSSRSLEDRVTDSPTLKSGLSHEVTTRPGVVLPQSHLDMNDSTSMQVMHMQEQIASQNRMIERLQRLVKTLDSEREFYKEEIAVLKRDIDVLTNTMKSQSSVFNSELKASNMKNEVMKEINKVKAMMHNIDRDSNKRSSLLSPRLDPDFWNVKENISDNLEQVRFELNQMKRRIDHMEDRLARSPPSKPDPIHTSLHEADHLLTRPLYTPTSGIIPRQTDSDLQLLKLSISSMNEKLDNLERRSRLQVPSFHTNFHSGEHHNAIHSSPPNYSPYTPLSCMTEDDYFGVHSLSDLSDLSYLNDDGSIDDLDFDLMMLNVKEDDVDPPPSSHLKPDSSKTSKKLGKVDFDLRDLELSDIDDEGDIDLEPSDLDLNF